MNSSSSILFTATVLERFEKLNSRISLEINVEGAGDCRNYVHLLVILAIKKETRNQAIDLYKEIYIDCEELNYHNFNPNSSVDKYMVLLSMQLCEWLLLKDISIDFNTQPSQRTLSDLLGIDGVNAIST